MYLLVFEKIAVVLHLNPISYYVFSNTMKLYTVMYIVYVCIATTTLVCIAIAPCTTLSVMLEIHV